MSRCRVALLSSTMLTGLVGALVVPTLAGAQQSSPRPGYATQQPAVDGLNTKMEAFGGSVGSNDLFGAGGAISAPLGTSYGLQIDGIAGNFDDDFFGSGGAHLFWRDPSRALLGLYASHASWDRYGGVRVNRYGVEGFVYGPNWTFGGIVGGESGNTVSAVVGNTITTYDIKSRFFDTIDLAYYVNENFKLSIGHHMSGGDSALALGGEWGFMNAGGVAGSLFVEGRIGQGDSSGAWGGMRFYFGQKDKTLIARHRQDDPPIPVIPTLFSFAGSLSTAIAPSGGGGDKGDGDGDDGDGGG